MNARQSEHIKIHIDGHQKDGITVVAFRCNCISLSQDYRIEVEAKCKRLLDLICLVGKTCRLTITKNKVATYLHGMISHVSHIGITPDGQSNHYAIEIHSPLLPLKNSFSSRVFINKSITEIAIEMLEENNWSNNNYKVLLKKQCPISERVVQHLESDYDFLLRQLNHFSLFFCFKQCLDSVELIITDEASLLASEFEHHTIEYNPTVVFAIHQTRDCQQHTVTLSTNDPAFTPGQRLTIKHCPLVHLNRDYHIIRMEMACDKNTAQIYVKNNKSGMAYSNNLILMSAETPYHHPRPHHKQHHGVQIGFIDNPEDQPVYLDNNGSYHIRSAFDLADHQKGHASNAIPLMQPYSGLGYGFHFPLHHGTVILTLCVNGDPNHPILLGVLPSRESPSPVNANNATENILRTWSGNELLMDDNNETPCIRLSTNNQDLCVSLEAKKNAHRISFGTQLGQLKIKAHKDLCVKSGKDFLLTSGGERHVIIEQQEQVQTQNKDIHLQAATDIIKPPSINKKTGTIIVPMGSICLSGFKVTRPSISAVLSPNLLATHPCATS